MDSSDDLSDIKKRLERKIRENRFELREFYRQEIAAVEKKLAAEIYRIDSRLRSCEQRPLDDSRGSLVHRYSMLKSNVSFHIVFFAIGVIVGVFVTSILT